VCLFIFTPEVTVGAFDLSSTSSVLKKELLKISTAGAYLPLSDLTFHPAENNL
jgi:hypothetical protein